MAFRLKKEKDLRPRVILAQNLNPNVSVVSLSRFVKELCPHVHLSSADIPPEWSSNNDKTGFLEFGNPDDCIDALECLNGFAFMGRQISAKFYPEPTEEVIQEIAVGKLKKRQQAMELRNRCQGFQQNQILTNKPANSLNTTDPYSYHPRSQQNVQYHAYADYQFFQNQTARQSILHENLCNPHIQPKYNQHLQKQQFTHQQQHQHSLRIRTEGAFAPSPISPSPISPMSPLSPVTDNFANSKGFNPAIWTYTGQQHKANLYTPPQTPTLDAFGMVTPKQHQQVTFTKHVKQNIQW